MSIDNLQILKLYVNGVLKFFNLPYRGQNGFRSMQEQLIGLRIRVEFSYNL
jgi:hypothetical protein